MLSVQKIPLDKAFPGLKKLVLREKEGGLMYGGILGGACPKGRKLFGDKENSDDPQPQRSCEDALHLQAARYISSIFGGEVGDFADVEELVLVVEMPNEGYTGEWKEREKEGGGSYLCVLEELLGRFSGVNRLEVQVAVGYVGDWEMACMLVSKGCRCINSSSAINLERRWPCYAHELHLFHYIYGTATNLPSRGNRQTTHPPGTHHYL